MSRNMRSSMRASWRREDQRPYHRAISPGTRDVGRWRGTERVERTKLSMVSTDLVAVFSRLKNGVRQDYSGRPRRDTRKRIWPGR